MNKKGRGCGNRRTRGCGGGLLDALEPRRLLSGTLTIDGTANADTITIGVNSTGGIHLVVNNVATDYAAGDYSALVVNSGDGADTIGVQGTVVPTTISSTGAATVTLANGTGGLSGITAAVTVTNSSPLTHLILDDTGDPQPPNVSIGAGDGGAGLISGIAPAPITFDTSGVADLRVILPPNPEGACEVTQTLVPTAVELNASPAASWEDLQIQVGSALGLLGIAQPLTLIGGTAQVDDSPDPSARQATVSVASVASSVLGPQNADVIHGLAPADIACDSSSLSVTLPTIGGSRIDVQQCAPSLSLISDTGNRTGDAVRVGDGSLTGIGFPLFIANTSGSDDLTVDNSADAPGDFTFDHTQPIDGTGVQITEIAAGNPRVVLDNAGGGGTVTCLNGNSYQVDDLSALPNATLDLSVASVPGSPSSIGNTPAGSTVNVAGSGGTLHVAIGDSAAGAVNVSNEAGSLVLTVGDRLDTTPRDITLDAFTPDGSAHPWGRVSGLAPGSVSYEDVNATVSLTGGSGGDHWQIVNTPAEPLPSSLPKLHLVSNGPDTFTITGTGVNASLVIQNALSAMAPGGSTDTIDFSSGGISDGSFIQIYGMMAAGLTVRGASADDSFIGTIYGKLQHGTCVVNPTYVTSVRFETGTLHGAPLNSLELDGAQTTLLLGDGDFAAFNSLTLNGAKAVAGGTTVHYLSIQNLSITNGGQLDIKQNLLAVSYPSGTDAVATVRAYLRSGYDHGAWDGPGIISSTLDGSHGLALRSVPPSEAFLQPARYGDANLNGGVDFGDLLTLAQNYGKTNATWLQGDFDYDGTVGFSDLLTLAQHYNGSTGAAAMAAQPAEAAVDALPDPLRARRRRLL